MPRPHHAIPSQRLAVARSSQPEAPVQHRSVWWLVGITALGWALLAYPVLLLATLSLIIMTGSLGSTAEAQAIALGVMGLISCVVMIAFPPLLGFAVKMRRRGLWFAAIATGALTVAMTAYLLFGWIVPLA